MAGHSSGRAWVVGGAVRDWALGRPVRDIDLAIEGDVAGFGRSLARDIAGHFFVMHPASLTARVVRPDGGWIDLVPVTQNLDSNLRRRDFTINAMAARTARFAEALLETPPASRPEWLVDPAGGWDDLRRKIVRVASPTAIEEDSVRAVRALRLAATFGFALEPETEAHVCRSAPALAAAAPERVRDEWLLALEAPEPAAAVRLAAALGILDIVLPEWRKMAGVEQNGYHHLDVWGHTLEVLDNAVAPALPDDLLMPVENWARETVTIPHRRLGLYHLAVLLHDSGKPATRSADSEDGRVHFFGHERVGAAIAAEWARRWKLSARERAFVTDTVGLHMRPGALTTGNVSPRAIRRFFRDAGHAVPGLLLLNVADRLGARGPDTTDAELRAQAEGSWRLMREWFDSLTATTLPLPVSGRDLMAALGLAPGPAVGRLLAELEEIHADNPFPDKAAVLASAATILPVLTDSGATEHTD